MAAAFTDGAALVLGALLVIAGALKLRRPRGFGHAVARLLPKGQDLRGRQVVIRFAGLVVGAIEVVIGIALLASARVTAGVATAAAVGAAALYLAFVVIVAVAVRKGEACGCFQSFSDGAAGPAELARSVSLAALAVWVAARALAGDVPDPVRIGAVVPALLVLAAVTVVFIAAGGLKPRPLPGSSEPAGVRTGLWSLLGRVTSGLDEITPGSITDLSPDQHRQAVEAARSSPSVLAFAAWLGPRASEIDWKAASAVRVGISVAGRPAWGLIVRPPSRPDLAVAVSIPWDESRTADAHVVATVGGRPVSVVRGVVEVRGDTAGA